MTDITTARPHASNDNGSRDRTGRLAYSVPEASAAIGATRAQIMLQFLIESALLCVVGGILGLILAVGATQLIGFLLGMTMTITVFYVFISLFVSSFIGIIAGLYPAWKASRPG